MGKSGNVMCNGNIDSQKINNAHSAIKEIVRGYVNVNKEVDEITAGVRENWVGKGRNEFEAQYNILIKKIEDFGDTLYEIYDALVEAEAEYEQADDSLRQSYAMSMQE